MTPFEIEEYIEEQWKDPAVRRMVEAFGMTKDQWIMEASQPLEKKYVRCENCRRWPCEPVQNLRDDYEILVNLWYEWGCGACTDFHAKPDAT